MGLTAQYRPPPSKLAQQSALCTHLRYNPVPLYWYSGERLKMRPIAVVLVATRFDFSPTAQLGSVHVTAATSKVEQYIAAQLNDHLSHQRQRNLKRQILVHQQSTGSTVLAT